jgi:hypothetical protein
MTDTEIVDEVFVGWAKDDIACETRIAITESLRRFADQEVECATLHKLFRVSLIVDVCDPRVTVRLRSDQPVGYVPCIHGVPLHPELRPARPFSIATISAHFRPTVDAMPLWVVVIAGRRNPFGVFSV